MRNQRWSLILFGILASFWLAVGCIKTVGTTLTPAATPSPLSSLLAPPGPTTTAETPAVPVVPEPVATPVVIATRTTPMTVEPQPTPPGGTATPVAIEPSDPELAAVARHPKLGGQLAAFLRYRSRSPHFDHLPGMKEALEVIEALGGVPSGIMFKRVLSDSEIGRIERDFGARFARGQDGRLAKSRIHSVVIPIDKIGGILELPEVEQLDSGVWK